MVLLWELCVWKKVQAQYSVFATLEKLVYGSNTINALILLMFPCLLVNSPVKSYHQSPIANQGLDTANLPQRFWVLPSQTKLFDAGIQGESHIMVPSAAVSELTWRAFLCPNQTSPDKTPQLDQPWWETSTSGLPHKKNKCGGRKQKPCKFGRQEVWTQSAATGIGEIN